MIYGVGTDIVSVARMAANLERFGERFARRVLTAREYQEFRCERRPAQFLAKRFAAKEACVKALGTGFRDGLGLRDIGVGHDGLGRPLIEYHGRAEALRRARGIAASHLSIADERDYAIAFVALLAAPSA